jgi:UDP-N-acetylmuramoylalanine--D-glutamate ligase
MIPATGYAGARIAVLGLGRSGLAVARALRAGGADPHCWDDGAEARARAAAEGLALADPARPGGLEGIARLIVSPGIPHLYPQPHPAIRAAWAAQVPVDNDIGLFFRSLGQGGWADHDTPPRVVAVTGSNGKSTTAALIDHVLGRGRDSQLAGNIGRGVLDLDPPGDGAVDRAGAFLLPDGSGPRADPGYRGLHQPHARPSGPAWRHGRLFRGQAAALRRRRAGSRGHRRGRGRGAGSSPTNWPRGRGRAADPGVGGQALRARLGHLHAQGLALGMAQGAADRVDRSARDAGAAGGAQPPERGLRLCRGPRAGACAEADRGGLLLHRPAAPQPAVAEIGGVAFVNDSKATNVDAAVKALSAFPRIRWICGGLAKEAGWRRWRRSAGVSPRPM